jgi:BolA family transcriptional regulator, general stress-responsive regulator
MKNGRVERIRSRLEEAFVAASVSVLDDSARHAGHVAVRIESESFSGRSRLERHRLVYQALADMMAGDIHALNIEAISPDDENTSRNK